MNRKPAKLFRFSLMFIYMDTSVQGILVRSKLTAQYASSIELEIELLKPALYLKVDWNQRSRWAGKFTKYCGPASLFTLALFERVSKRTTPVEAGSNHCQAPAWATQFYLREHTWYTKSYIL